MYLKNDSCVFFCFQLKERLLLSYLNFLESSTEFQHYEAHIKLALFSMGLPLRRDRGGCCVPQIDLMLDEYSQ